MILEDLSNEQLLSGLHALVAQGRTVLARLFVYLAEVEDRRLDLESACSSLFDFCVRRLGMGDDEACRRVAGARLVRRFPMALAMIERGELHLTGLLLLREHLTDENHEELLRAASGKTKSEVQRLVAERFPRTDAPSRIQTLPAVTHHGAQLGGANAGPITSGVPGPKPARVEPLSPERYKVQFTASVELKEKIERAADLMRHANPSGDLSIVMDRALDLLIAQLEKRRLGKAARAPKNASTRRTRKGYVPRAVRRDVFERDGEQCTYMDDSGRRCPSRAFLELDHQTPRALGGADNASNLSVKCRAHNQLAAERAFGREKLALKKQNREKVHPRQCGYGDERALRALCSMGFTDREVRRALAIVEQQRGSSRPPPIETLLREALSVLA
jgi:5-methylcytosine-specific restriction endonuclease McrA